MFACVPVVRGGGHAIVLFFFSLRCRSCEFEEDVYLGFRMGNVCEESQLVVDVELVVVYPIWRTEDFSWSSSSESVEWWRA